MPGTRPGMTWTGCLLRRVVVSAALPKRYRQWLFLVAAALVMAGLVPAIHALLASSARRADERSAIRRPSSDTRVRVTPLASPPHARRARTLMHWLRLKDQFGRKPEYPEENLRSIASRKAAVPPVHIGAHQRNKMHQCFAWRVGVVPGVAPKPNSRCPSRTRGFPRRYNLSHMRSRNHATPNRGTAPRVLIRGPMSLDCLLLLVHEKRLRQ